MLTGLVQQIQSFHQASSKQITVYEGLESYRSYWVNSLERFPVGTIDQTVGAPSNTDWFQLMGPSYKVYLKLRLKKKIFWKTIHYKITQGELEMLRDYPTLTEYRLWPRDTNVLGNFNVIHDTVILHTINTPPRITEVRDADLVKVFRGYFDMMWEKSQPVTLIQTTRNRN